MCLHLGLSVKVGRGFRVAVSGIKNPLMYFQPEGIHAVIGKSSGLQETGSPGWYNLFPQGTPFRCWIRYFFFSGALAAGFVSAPFTSILVAFIW